MAYIVETSMNEDLLPKGYFEDEPPAWSKPWRPVPADAYAWVKTTAGYPIPPDRGAPTTAVIRQNWIRLPDFFSLKQNVGVSTVFKEIVEGLEPGVHQFFPLQVRRQDGGAIEGGYWLFVICNLIDTAIDPERSTVKVKEAAPGSAYWHYAPTDGRVIAVKKAVIRGVHAWIDRRYQSMFFSDALVAALDAKNIAGLVERNYVEETE